MWLFLGGIVICITGYSYAYFHFCSYACSYGCVLLQTYQLGLWLVFWLWLLLCVFPFVITSLEKTAAILMAVHMVIPLFSSYGYVAIITAIYDTIMQLYYIYNHIKERIVHAV